MEEDGRSKWNGGNSIRKVGEGSQEGWRTESQEGGGRRVRRRIGEGELGRRWGKESQKEEES